MDVVFSIEQLGAVAKQFWKEYGRYRVFAVKGEMGAGKTTFIHALCDVLGVKDAVGSPTFSIINQYQTDDGEQVFHMDLYRLKDEEEIISAGVEDAFYRNAVCFVEWPQLAAALLPADTVYAELLLLSEKERLLKVRIPG